jgi:hypothetical protein
MGVHDMRAKAASDSESDAAAQELLTANEKRVRACGSNPLIYLAFLVGVKGFEPSTPCTPCKCATRLRHTPKLTIIAVRFQ